MKSMIVLAATLCAAVPAQATDWRPVVADLGTLIHLVDADTLPKVKGTQMTVRTLMVVAEGTRTDFQAMEMTSEFDCAGNRVRMMRSLAYDGEGKPLPTDNSDKNGWSPIEPDTGFAGLAEVVCGKRPVSAKKLAGEVPITDARVLIGTAPTDGE